MQTWFTHPLLGEIEIELVTLVKDNSPLPT